MHVEPIEIYSDATNAAIMRHPGRHFPGVLLQGDTLYSLCVSADALCASVSRGAPAFDESNQLRNVLWSMLNHYKIIMGEHGLPLPFGSVSCP